MIKKLYLSGLLLSAVSLMIFIWYINKTTFAIKLDEKVLLKTADIQVQGLRLEKYNSQGTLEHTIIASTVTHIPENNSHWFINPYLTLYRLNQPLWNISAQKAHALKGDEEIIFTDNVLLQQERLNKITTEKLRYFPKQAYATTNNLIKFEQSGQNVESLGMWAYLNKKIIHLNSQVKAYYAP